MVKKVKIGRVGWLIILVVGLILLTGPVLFLAKAANFGPKVEWEYNDPKLDFVGKIAIDSKNNFYVTNHSNIYKFDSNHNLIATWGKQEGNRPDFRNAIAFDKEDRAYVTEGSTGKVEVYDSNGQLLKSWGEFGNSTGQMAFAQGIAVDPVGFVYVANSGVDRVEKFDLNGNLVNEWGGRGSGRGSFNGPIGIAVDSQGNVFVADAVNNLIQKFDGNGQFLQEWGQPSSTNVSIKIYGVPQSNVVGEEKPEGYLNFPSDLAIDSQGNIQVADRGNQRIQVFDTNGKFIKAWDNKQALFSHLENPGGLAVDKSGNIYVYNWGINQGLIKYSL